MSLQLAAKHLAAKGRGPDKQLVHMSPREVAGLQALAMAHGGSLTTNPDTGLPEAGFLDNLLPTIIGAGLMFATGGAAGAAIIPGLSNAATIGLGIGGLETMRTGNLQKGIMAGLGAYGGAGLTAGLAGPGMAVTNPAAPQIAMEQAAQAGVTGAGNVPFEFGLSDPSLGLAEQAEIARAAGTASPIPRGLTSTGSQTFDNMIADEMLRNPPAPLSYGPMTEAEIAAGRARNVAAATTPAPVSLTPSAATAPAAPVFDPAVYNQAAINQDAAGAAFRVPTTTDAAFNQAAINQDIAGAATRGPSTFAERFSAMPGKDLAKYGLAAAAPVLLAPPEYDQPELDREQYRYAYSPGPVMPPTRMGDVGEYTYFRPQYTRLAMGGPVEAMSAANVYDMQNARGGVSDMGIDNSTGMQKMASGGMSVLRRLADRINGDNAPERYAYNPVTQSYSAGLGSLMAGGSDDAQRYAYDPRTQTYSQVAPAAPAAPEASAAPVSYDYGGGMAKGGGISDLGDYSDGGRLLKGPGNGTSDDIPAMIGQKQPARLADGEFVIPARIVSEIGNGSTNAGARELYAMMDRIQKARGKTTGKGKVAVDAKARHKLPA
jgi:hypothetical protein